MSESEAEKEAELSAEKVLEAYRRLSSDSRKVAAAFLEFAYKLLIGNPNEP